MTKRVPIVTFLMVLFCIWMPSAKAHSRNSMPQGGYLISCNSCYMDDNNILKCYCQNRRGRTKSTSLYIGQNCGAVENDNGQLRCTGSPAPSPRPRPDDDYDHRGRIFEVETRLIWSQFEAEQRCDRICDRQNGKWTGNWRNIRNGQASLCECKKRHHRDQDDGLGINIRL